MPDWVLREERSRGEIAIRPLTESGVTKRLYAAVRADEANKPFMQTVLRLAREIPEEMRAA
jgi:LysR family transcriptional regulator for metE and metH